MKLQLATTALAIVLSMMATAHAGRTEDCRAFKDALEIRKALDGVWDSISTLVGGEDEHSRNLARFAGTAHIDARNLANVAALEASAHASEPHKAILGKVVAVRVNYRKIVEDILAGVRHDPHRSHTLDAGPKLDEAYYTLVLAAACQGV